MRRWLHLARRALAYELAIYVGLARWLARRPDVPAGARAFGSMQASTPVMALWIFGSAVEIPVAHVLLPWEGARTVVLGLGVWGLLWMVGLLGGLRAYPHLLEPGVLRVRRGPRTDLRVPLDAVEKAVVRRADLPSSARGVQPVETDRGTHVRVGVSGETNVHLVLSRPVELQLPGGPVTAVEVSLLADDPRGLVDALHGALAAAR